MSGMNRRTLLQALCTGAVSSTIALAEPASDDEARGRELLQAARDAATGGQELLDYAFDLDTIIQLDDGRRVKFTSSVQVIPPSTFRQHIVSAAGSQTMFFAGDSAWQQTIEGRRDLPDSVVRSQAADLERGHVLYRSTEETALYRGTEEVEGRPAEVIQVADVAGAPLRLFLDKRNFDLLKRVYVGDAPGGGMAQVEEYLSDYREAGGFRWPARKRVVRNGQEALNSTATNFAVNQGLERETLLR